MSVFTFNCILRSLKSLSATRVNICRASSVAQRKYDLYAAICVERKPVTIPELSQFVESYENLLHSIELQDSLKSDFELELELQARKAAAGEMDAGLVSAQDKLEKYEDEKEEFVAAPTKTDEEHNYQSLNRSLSVPLSLLVKQNVGSDAVWWLPTAKLAPGETLRQASEKALSQCCGDDLTVHHLGNAPFGFHKYKYPEAVQKKTGVYGAKLWFMRAVYVSGEVVSQKATSIDHQWLSQRDLLTKLDPRYSKSLSSCLLHA